MTQARASAELYVKIFHGRGTIPAHVVQGQRIACLFLRVGLCA